jgi:hypothetical protein
MAWVSDVSFVEYLSTFTSYDWVRFLPRFTMRMWFHPTFHYRYRFIYVYIDSKNESRTCNTLDMYLLARGLFDFCRQFVFRGDIDHDLIVCVEAIFCLVKTRMRLMHEVA